MIGWSNPGLVLECHGAIKDGVTGVGVRIHAEVPEAFELKTCRWRRGAQRRFKFAAGDHLKGVRIDLFEKVRVARPGRLTCEQSVVQPYFAWQRGLDRHPVHVALHLVEIRTG